MPPTPPMRDEYKKFRTEAPSGYTAIKGSPPAAVVKIAKEMLKSFGAQQTFLETPLKPKLTVLKALHDDC